MRRACRRRSRCSASTRRSSGVAIVTGQLGTTVGTGAVVAEWVTGKVKFVRLTHSAAGYEGRTESFLTGFANPVPVLVDATGALFVGDWTTRHALPDHRLTEISPISFQPSWSTTWLTIRGVSSSASGIAGDGGGEVLALDVHASGVAVAERLDQHELVRRVDAARPLEPEVAGLGARRLGERRRRGRATGRRTPASPGTSPR